LGPEGFSMNVSRRSCLLSLAALGFAPVLPTVAQAAAAPRFKLPPLPYAPNALEPFIDTETMKLHHDKHHAAYVTGLNNALAKTPGKWSNWSLEQLLKNLDALPAELRTPVRNHGGGHWNHTFFWETMGPQRGMKPAPAFRSEVEKTFGSWKAFEEKFVKAGLDRFGSGWAWLVRNPAGKLEVVSTPNQDTPLSGGHRPLLGVDVWEHAYYLKYQNRRKDYLENFWNVVRWDVVSRRAAAKA
jgi:superoxide dismutase, Fe-Mn family